MSGCLTSDLASRNSRICDVEEDVDDGVIQVLAERHFLRYGSANQPFNSRRGGHGAVRGVLHCAGVEAGADE